MPNRGVSVIPFQPNSEVVVLPRNTAPASRSRATGGASSVAGSSDRTAEPSLVGKPAMATMSFTVTGTPSRSPAGRPAAHRSALAAAAALAPSWSTTTKAFSRGWSRSMRSRCSSTTSTGDSSPLR